MQPVKVSAIAAIGRNQELGTANQLSWRIRADLKRVKELTTGHTIIMGRKTYESIGRPLPNRTNIVVTRDTNFTADGCVIAHSIEAALEKAREFEQEEIFVFGGAQIYAATMPCVETLYLTEIADTDPNADAFFPPFREHFQEVKRHGIQEQDGLAYEWVDYVRR